MGRDRGMIVDPFNAGDVVRVSHASHALQCRANGDAVHHRVDLVTCANSSPKLCKVR